jgi:hypothetical protein
LSMSTATGMGSSGAPRRNGFGPDPDYVIYCGDLPDPPNNSG